MPRFPPYVEKKLRAIGWFPGRDVSADFKFSPQSRLFPASVTVYREFGYLHIPAHFLETLQPEDPTDAIIFDIDNSQHSIRLRRKQAGLPDPEVRNETTSQEQSWQALDQQTTEEEIFEFLDEAEAYFGTPCARLTSLSYLGSLPDFEWMSEAYMPINGAVYDTHHYQMIAPSFDEFLIALLKKP